MSKIRSKNTKVENLVFKELRRRKIYFQKHYKKSPGNPDIAFPKRKIAIFIDGDFWHGYNFKKWGKSLPKKYWLAKIAKNMQRDKINKNKLKRQGWKVLRIWEHEIENDLPRVIDKIKKIIEN